MRTRVVTELTDLLAEDADTCLLTADTGFHALDELRARFPDRVINVGIAEAGMAGMAAGLAHMKKRVFCYGIAPFVTIRCLEHIRVDLCAANLPVCLIGVGGGLTYGPTGMTHHAIEDIAGFRNPGMEGFCHEYHHRHGCCHCEVRPVAFHNTTIIGSDCRFVSPFVFLPPC